MKYSLPPLSLISLFSASSFLNSVSQDRNGQESGPAQPQSNVSTLCFLRRFTEMLCVLYACECFCVFRGVCRCCGSELESIQLTEGEYQELKDRVMADIIQGQDVFNKTTPEVNTHAHIKTDS